MVLNHVCTTEQVQCQSSNLILGISYQSDWCEEVRGVDGDGQTFPKCGESYKQALNADWIGLWRRVIKLFFKSAFQFGSEI